jgi:hypothetical protein
VAAVAAALAAMGGTAAAAEIDAGDSDLLL